MKRIIKIFLLIFITIFLFGNLGVNADDWYEEESIYQQGLDDPLSNPNIWKPSVVEEPELLEKAGTILGVINVIGIVCSVLVLTIIGIKYMVGSIEEKAEYKKTMSTYILGMFMLVSATTIPNLIYIVVKGMI